jgi:hypothetical protein
MICSRFTPGRKRGQEAALLAYRADSRAMLARGQSDDVRERCCVVLEKREPEFTDQARDGLPALFPAQQEPVH